MFYACFYKSVACVVVPSVEAMSSIGRCFGWLLPLYAYLGIRVEHVDRFTAFMHAWGKWAEMNLLQVHNSVSRVERISYIYERSPACH
jgi:hypothetical protein